MIIAISSDHAGYEYKQQILIELQQKGHQLHDYGTFSAESCDYPDFAVVACNAVAQQKADMGILICGTGIGMSIAANKVAGIRCALCVNSQMAKLARQHNNANVLAVGARLNDLASTKEIITTFLNTPFEGGRHTQRVEKINKLDK